MSSRPPPTPIQPAVGMRKRDRFKSSIKKLITISRSPSPTPPSDATSDPGSNGSFPFLLGSSFSSPEATLSTDSDAQYVNIAQAPDHSPPLSSSIVLSTSSTAVISLSPPDDTIYKPSFSQSFNSQAGGRPTPKFVNQLLRSLDIASAKIKFILQSASAPALQSTIENIQKIVLEPTEFDKNEEEELARLKASTDKLNAFLEKEADVHVLRVRIKCASEELVLVNKGLNGIVINGVDARLSSISVVKLFRLVGRTFETIGEPRSELNQRLITGIQLTLKLLEKAFGTTPIPGIQALFFGLWTMIAQSKAIADLGKSLQSIFESIDMLNAVLESASSDPTLETPNLLKRLKETASADMKAVESRMMEYLDKNIASKIVDVDSNMVSKILEDIRSIITRLMAGSITHTHAITWTILKDVERNTLERLPHAQSARWRPNVEIFRECLSGTRVSVIRDVMDWVQDSGGKKILCITGMAGFGKSTLASTIASIAADQGVLGATFFCRRDEEKRSDVGYILPTLAFQLVLRIRNELLTVIRNSEHVEDIFRAPLRDQLTRLIVEPFARAGWKSGTVLIIIDALDECRDSRAPSKLLATFAESISLAPFLKVIVTCRPEEDPRVAFNQNKDHIRVLDLSTAEDIDDDIYKYLNSELRSVLSRRTIGDPGMDWPPPALVSRLTQKAAGMFIFASVASKSIKPDGDLYGQLASLANLSTDSEGRQGIDQLYRRIISMAIMNFSKEEIAECRSVLGFILLAQNPVCLTDASQLIGRSRDHVYGLLSGFHSVLVIPRFDDTTSVIRAVHKSFRDFLTEKGRCKDKCDVNDCRIAGSCGHPKLPIAKLWVNIPRHHGDISSRLLHLLEEQLERHQDDISGLLAYSCRHWANHLKQVPYTDKQAIPKLSATLDKFVRSKILFWVESLSTLKNLNVAVFSLSTVQMWVKGITGNDGLEHLLYDTHRLVLENFHAIECSPKQIYHSALLLVPTETTLADVYSDEILATTARTGVLEKWNPCFRTMVHESSAVSTAVKLVAVSPDGKYLASVTFEEPALVRVWLVSTGQRREVFKGLELWITCVGFLDNGWVCSSYEPYEETGDGSDADSWIATDSDSWITTEIAETDHVSDSWIATDNAEHVISAADDCSADITKVDPSTSYDYTTLINKSTTYIWNAETGELVDTRSGMMAALSPSGKYHLFKLEGDTLKIIDLLNESEHTKEWREDIAETSLWMMRRSGIWSPEVLSEPSFEQRLESMPLRHRPLNHTFSRDGKLAAVGCDKSDIHILDLTIKDPDDPRSSRRYRMPASIRGWSLCVSFSPDGRYVAGSGDQICVWDVDTGELKAFLQGHTSQINSIAFSPDGQQIISGSSDGTMKIWDFDHKSDSSLRPGPLSWVKMIAFASDDLAASCAWDGTLSLWDRVTGHLRKTWRASVKPIVAVAFIPKQDHLLISVDHEMLIKIWDLEERRVRTIKHRTLVIQSCAMSFSSNGRTFACISECEAFIFDMDSQASRLIRLREYSAFDCSVQMAVFSPDDQYVAAGYDRGELHVYAVASSSLVDHPVVLKGTFLKYAFLSDSGKLMTLDWDAIKRGQALMIPCAPTRLSEMLYIHGGWITRGDGERLCWVPESYRGADVYEYDGQLVALGGGDGWVLFIDFGKKGRTGRVMESSDVLDIDFADSTVMEEYYATDEEE